MNFKDAFADRSPRRIAIGFLVVAVGICGMLLLQRADVVTAGGPVESVDTYRVLAPIESGNLLLFPVVRTNSMGGAESPFVTLDEGLKNGSVEVTEAGKARGLVRGRGNGAAIIAGDQV